MLATAHSTLAEVQAELAGKWIQWAVIYLADINLSKIP